jgi:hypothetical protein
MRTASLALLIVIGVATPACEGKKTAAGATSQADMAARVEALQKEESGVLARRSELERERQAVKEARVVLEEKKRTGADPQVIATEEKALAEREAKLEHAETQNTQDVEKLLREYQALTASSGAGDVTKREASMAIREKDVARREDQFAARERELAARERDLAKRERETCSAVPTIVQAPLPAGSKYSKRDVEPTLAKARKRMSEKGILSSDLPPGASHMEKEATESMGSGDYGRAKLIADQFLATVSGIQIDRTFIMAKINRLSAQMKAKQTSREVEELFRGATADYGDGKFVAANGKLNKIYSVIR